jgi:hypothetical protein
MQQMCGKLLFSQGIKFTWIMTSIIKWAIFNIPYIFLIILMINETLKLVQLKPRLSPHLSNVMDASRCSCTFMSHQYKVNLGQPRVNLG